MKPERYFYVYMIVSASRRVLYTGMTNNLMKRVQEHRDGTFDGFSKIYKAHRLVYYEAFRFVKNAIDREKIIKGWTRAKKNELVESKNPHWEDLGEQLGKQKVLRVAQDDKGVEG